MQLHMKPGSKPLRAERELTDKLMRLSTRVDDTAYAIIGIERSDGIPRIVVTCHTHSEYIGAIRVLEDQKFKNQGLSTAVDAQGNLVFEVNKTNLPLGMHELFRE